MTLYTVTTHYGDDSPLESAFSFQKVMIPSSLLTFCEIFFKIANFEIEDERQLLLLGIS